MANRIEFIADLSVASFIAGLKQLETAAAAAQARMARINALSASAAGAPFGHEAMIEKEAAEWRAFETQRAAQKAAARAQDISDTLLATQAQKALRDIQADAQAKMLAGFEKQRVAAAALKAEQLASIKATAIGGVGSVLVGHFAEGGGGFSGIIRESLVLIREFGRGNWTRMAGSFTLLAQYTGTLNKLFRSTASGALELFEAENQLAISTAQKALASEKAAEAMALDAAATIADKEASAAAATVDREAAVAQEAKAVAAAESAKMQLLSAKFSVTAMGWVVGALVLVGIAAYEVIKHFVLLHKQHEEFIKDTETSRRTIEEEAKAMDENRKAGEDLNKWLEKELANRKQLADVMRDRIDNLHAEAQAQEELMKLKGASATQINQFEIQQLQKEKEILQVTQDQAKAELAKAVAAVQSNEAALEKLNAEGKSFGGGKPITLDVATQHLAAAQQTVEALSQLTHWVSTGTKMGVNPVTGVAMQQETGFMAPGPSSGSSQESVTVGTKTFTTTLDEANAELKKNQAIVEDLSKQQDDLTGSIADGKDQIQTLNGTVNQTTQEIQKNQNELKIKSGTGAQIAALEDMKRKGGGGSVANGLIQSGNFLGLSSNAISSMQAKLVSLAQQQVRHLASIDSKMGSHSGKTGFSF